ncbi:MAG: phosphoribosylformylglycinamidine synthase subunit PurS [Chitinophagia bacterium]|nr:phosphoribosylformylglycinamidine synthase subunit PurS [Chitinophagia bacterium]
MKFKAQIDIMPRQGLLDPQGKAVNSSVHNMGFTQINNIRIGKHIDMDIEATDAEAAKAMATDACQRLLANLVMEDYHVTITE